MRRRAGAASFPPRAVAQFSPASSVYGDSSSRSSMRLRAPRETPRRAPRSATAAARSPRRVHRACGIPPRHRLDAILRAQHAGIEVEPLRHRVAHRLERRHAVVEVRVALPAARLRESAGSSASGTARPRAIASSTSPAALLDDAARHPLHLTPAPPSRGAAARQLEQQLVAHHAEGRAVELGGHAVAPVRRARATRPARGA